MKNYLLLTLSIFIVTQLWATNQTLKTDFAFNKDILLKKNSLTDILELNGGRKNRKSNYKRSKSSKYSFQIQSVKKKRFQIRLKRRKVRYRLSH